MRLPRALRLLLITFVSVTAAMVLIVLVALYLFLQPDRFTAMLQKQANDAGLELSLSSPASPTLFPRPALQMEGITLGARYPANSMPILVAARGQLVLPWHAVFSRQNVISRIQIESPRVDLDALQTWLSSLPPESTAVPPELPRIATGVRIRDGSVVHGDTQWLNGVSLDTSRLDAGQMFWVRLTGKEPNGTPMRLELSTLPHIDGNILRLDNLNAHLADNKTTVLELSGSARWMGAADVRLDLRGKYNQVNGGSYDASIALTPADQSKPLLLDIKLLGNDNRVDVQLPPLALAQWWHQLNDAQTPKLDLPPGNGEINVASFDTGKMHIEGLRIQNGTAVGTNNPGASKPVAPGPQ